MKLFAPQSYWNAPLTVREEMTGGCGPGRIGDYFVPDTIYGLNVKKACKIHDWMYFLGEVQKDKKKADRVFLNNMLRIIAGAALRKAFPWYYLGLGFLIRIPLMRLRIRRAYTYYKAVKRFGAGAFYKGKNSDTEYKDGGLA